jgi:hypothetical protein
MSSESSTRSLRSSRSGSQSSSSSSAGSHGEDDGLDAFFANYRPSHKDYESYTTLVRHIDKGEKLIAKRILAARPSEQEGTIGGDVAEDQDEEPREKSNSRANGRTNVSNLSTAWPLRPADIGHQAAEATIVLQDAILAFASAYIRQHQLVHPRQQLDVEGESTTMADIDGLIPAFLPNVMNKVDSLLNSLASMHPAAQPKRRAQMRPMGWGSVISAGVLCDIDHRSV